MNIAGSGGQELLALLMKTTARTLGGGANAADDDEQAKAREARDAKARDALDAIKRAKVNLRGQRKAAAAQKVERLKKELQALRMFSAGGDPKAIARQVARIARELAGAVREYRGLARTSMGGESASAAPSATGDTQAAASTAAGNTATAQAQAQVAQVQVQAGQGETPKAGQAIIDALAAPLAQSRKEQAETAGNKEFEREVRLLHQHLKAVLEEQRRRAAAEHRADGEFESFDRTLSWAGRVVAGSELVFPLNLQT